MTAAICISCSSIILTSSFFLYWRLWAFVFRHFNFLLIFVSRDILLILITLLCGSCTLVLVWVVSFEMFNCCARVGFPYIGPLSKLSSRVVPVLVPAEGAVGRAHYLLPSVYSLFPRPSECLTLMVRLLNLDPLKISGVCSLNI